MERAVRVGRLLALSLSPSTHFSLSLSPAPPSLARPCSQKRTSGCASRLRFSWSFPVHLGWRSAWRHARRCADKLAGVRRWSIAGYCLRQRMVRCNCSTGMDQLITNLMITDVNARPVRVIFVACDCGRMEWIEHVVMPSPPATGGRHGTQVSEHLCDYM